MLKGFSKGGVHPPGFKISRAEAIVELPPPTVAVIPLSQHIGAPAVPCVAKGDRVVTGQLIAAADGFVSANVHSSVSGTVTAVGEVPDAGGVRRPAITIAVEGDQWLDIIDRSESLVKECHLTRDEIITRIKNAGIVGMGGATFPTHVKLSVPVGKKAEFLIVNGVECEPFLTADHRVMLERGAEMLVGTDILSRALGVDKAYIGIENNKPDAIEHLRQLSAGYPDIEVVPLRVRYPQGGEKQLIEAVLGREVPSGGLPIDVGAVVQNAGTTLAVYEAVQKNKPLIERVVTVTGRAMSHTANLKVRIGTPISSLIEYGGGMPEDTGKIVNGGPMMGSQSGSSRHQRNVRYSADPSQGLREKNAAKLHQVCQMRRRMPHGTRTLLDVRVRPPVTLRGARSGPYHGLHRVRLLFLHLSCLPAAAGLYPAGQVGSGQNSPGAKSPIG